MVSQELKDEGWHSVYADFEKVPKGEIIWLGEYENGKFSFWETELTKKYKKFTDFPLNDHYFYEKDGMYHILRTDQYWKNI